MKELIDNINSILKDNTLILHIEQTSTAIKSINKIDYILYAFGKKDERPYKIWSLSRNIKVGEDADSIDAKLELLKFIVKGGISQYE